LLAGAIGLCGLTARQPPLPPKSDDSHKADRPLADLSDRLHQALEKQTAIHDSTKALDQVIQGVPAKEPRPADRQVSRKLAADEQNLVNEMDKAIDLLQASGSAPALAEVFRQLRADMKRVQGSLEHCDLGSATQVIEEDILATLGEMIAALQRQ
jgi:hypothetical protein